tara:strand:+ start:134 stop:616 length:483 start_codon:yes stop_codon:yes gene_type:complete
MIKALHIVLFTFWFTYANGSEDITIRIGGAIYANKDSLGDDFQLIERSLPAESGILDALASVGGCSEAASIKMIIIIRQKEDKKEKIRIDAIECLGRKEIKEYLLNGDTIYVPKILEAYPAPHYFNHMLFEWIYHKSKKNELPTRWPEMLNQMNYRGVAK